MNIYDIAKKSGVSIATISRVLNGGKNVSSKTYQRVMDTINKEGYTPNIFARGLGLDTMQTIGILVTDASDPHYAKIISLLAENLRNLGLNTLLSVTGNDLVNKQRELQLLLEHRVDAIFLAGSAQQELRGNHHIKEAAKQVPIIMVNGHIKAPGVINVSSNESDAVVNCLDKLFESGQKKPLYIYDHITYSGKQKQRGFERGLNKHGIKPDASYMLRLKGSLLDMKNALLRAIDKGKSFDCIIASEDRLAVAAQKALQERQLCLPVIGFNNSILAEVSSPTLTSIDNMLEPLCNLAVELFRESSKGQTTSTHITLDCQLVERESFQSIGH